MKNLFLFALFALALYVPKTEAQSFYLLDTLESSSSIDTVILYFGGDAWGDEGVTDVEDAYLFQPGGVFTCYCETDSLSGSTNATMYLEYGMGSDPPIWLRETTTALNGAATQTIETQTTTFGYNRARIWAVTASGTQNTRIKCTATYSKKPH